MVQDPQQFLTDRRVPRRRPGDDEADRILRNEKVQLLHASLSEMTKGYVGLFETGSAAVGDPWVRGRSDRDIAVVLSGRINDNVVQAVSRSVTQCNFNDAYLVYPMHLGRFLSTKTDQDIAMKFGGVRLFGQDLLTAKDTPSRAFADGVARAGLRATDATFRVLFLNAQHWSLGRVRNELYTDIKRLFMYLGYKHYADTGEYPKRRHEVVEAYGSAQLGLLASSLLNIDEAGRESLAGSTRSAVDVLRQVMFHSERP